MSLKIKKEELQTTRWNSGENNFQLNVVNDKPVLLVMEMEGHNDLRIHDTDTILMIKQFFHELELVGQ